MRSPHAKASRNSSTSRRSSFGVLDRSLRRGITSSPTSRQCLQWHRSLRRSITLSMDITIIAVHFYNAIGLHSDSIGVGLFASLDHNCVGIVKVYYIIAYNSQQFHLQKAAAIIKVYPSRQPARGPCARRSTREDCANYAIRPRAIAAPCRHRRHRGHRPNTHGA